MNELINISTDFSGCPELVDRLLRRDASLWSSDPGVQRAIDNRLGWLDAAAFMDGHNARILDFVQGIRAKGYQQAVLLGMGGSSLAPEVYTALFGDGSGSLPLTVVDSTSPQHVAAVTRQCEDRATLFIVSSKSGSTAETSALEAHFFEWARARFDQPQQHFVAITDSGSPLQTLASERGYRDTFLNPADIGGRFSALSYFGLVPAALAGADLSALRAHLPEPGAGSPSGVEACRLGAAVASCALKGRNKLTLLFSPGLAPLGAWVEQLIDESTGKDGTGIVVVPDEPPLEPDAYSADRFFAVVDLDGERVDASTVEALTARGHPVARWRLAGLDQLGAELYRWQVATAMAGRALGINPFDEPDVEDAKRATRARLAQSEATPGDPPQSVAAVAEALAGAGPGDYLAILAYLPPSAGNRRRLRTLSTALTRRSGLPCCVNFGPRYLHSSGQLHKGGPNQGIFILITLDAAFDVPIPGQRHGFGALIRAQAGGDLQVLKERGRRVVHLEVGEQQDALDALTRSLA